MKISYLCLSMSLVMTASIHAQFWVNSSLSDWEDVIEAVHEANANGNGTIVLQSRAMIPVDQPLPNITGIVSFEGNGATFEAVPGYNGIIVEIVSSGRLDLTDVYITGFKRGFDSEQDEVAGLFDNSGVLNLERVTIAKNKHLDGEFVESRPIILNRNQAFLNNTTLFSNDFNSYPAILNFSDLRVSNSTFSANCKRVLGCIRAALCSWGCAPGTFGSTVGSSTELANNLINESNEACELKGGLVDRGGNFAPGDWCGLDGGKNALRGRARFADFRNHGGFVPTFGLQPGSDAIDTGNNEFCSPTDARLAVRPVQGELNQEKKCDAGAYEYGGGFGNPDLLANGMNGLWFSRESDGHYVHVMRVSSDRIHVTWTAFDNTANQLWIYSVIDSAWLNDGYFSAPAYVNLNGLLIPGGAPEGSHVEEWGDIYLNFESCTKGTFKYRAHDPNIGSGEIQIERLAFIESVGCAD